MKIIWEGRNPISQTSVRVVDIGGWLVAEGQHGTHAAGEPNWVRLDPVDEVRTLACGVYFSREGKGPDDP
jgi:hypothetical protein